MGKASKLIDFFFLNVLISNNKMWWFKRIFWLSGMYAVYGMEKEKKLKVKAKQFMQTDISKRREYAKGITMGTMCKFSRICIYL